MANVLSAVSIRARYILRQDGLLPLLKMGFVFLVQYVFRYGTFYLYEGTIDESHEADFTPKIQNFTFHIVSTRQQADDLAAEGFDCRSYSITGMKRLDKRAVAFCILIGRELAHVTWVAMTQEAKNVIDPIPYSVDFSNKEVCAAGALTAAKYRRKGLMRYSHYKRLQFLRERGATRWRFAVGTRNTASQRVQASLGNKIYAKARYLRILWWEFWRETPLMSGHADNR